MFSPPKLKTITTALAGLLTISGFSYAQDADYSRRLAAMQQARERANAPSANSASQPSQLRVASAGYDYSAPPTPMPQQRMAQVPTASRSSSAVQQRPAATRQASQRVPQSTGALPVARSNQPNRTYQNGPVARTASANSKYVPGHVRTAQLYDGAIVDGGSPVVGSSVGTYDAVVTDGYVDEGYYEDGGCSSCGDSGGYFDGGDSCCGRGGCPDGPCWLSGLGLILYNGDYFAGANGFQNAMFANSGANNALIGDCSFGFYGGVNYGIPLCRLSCGMLSGQLGVRSVQTNFNGNQFTTENRDQTFVTAGLYRRVDYGLQGGVVADILHENWFTTTDTIQLRADLGWVWPAGTTFGFRYAANAQDDAQTATINGTTIPSLNTLSQDYYRFYLRHEAMSGGYGEMFFGWTDADQTIFGMDADMPITETIAAQATFTYYLDDTAVPANSGFQGGNLGDAWNIAVGFAWRPQGRSYYRSYDRPLFNVADNGTMLITRQ